jgi:hypothetical protein
MLQRLSADSQVSHADAAKLGDYLALAVEDLRRGFSNE